MRRPTNSLILTNLEEKVLENPQELIDFLCEDEDYIVEFICLCKLSRIVLICETSSIAQSIKQKIGNDMRWRYIKVSFSMKDNAFDVSKQDLEVGRREDKNYLELPHDLDVKRFLISPPMSPRSGWDNWNKTEEGPNEKAIYSPEELSEILWERLGGEESKLVRRYNETSRETINYEIERELLFEGIENGVPAIVLDSVGKCEVEENMPKTSMPPVEPK
ncbi:hypothetical protein KGF56_000107 [Candida oxycetoniae]|uniref:Uncharacterized protein n=1 Tax=Candida oxycetoniae TaxID=497107 RepID=A0AAI9X0F2_9ASCO|nr:uncharacterized protein KGF56_000107 [Candida oxycetoniae]KAI3407119.1 hypothetical protein KGF56_000107 [Candida oxycetoniae]